MSSRDTVGRPDAPDFLTGGGEMGALMRVHDWSSSPLGAPQTWPQALRAVVALMINSRYPMFIAWGPELAFLYNDGYAPIFGAKHPHALGLPFREVWSEIWDDLRPLVDAALAGEATYHENLHLVMERNGYPEDTWYSFSYSPVRDESGAVAGMFCACTETTQAVLAERREAAERERLAKMFEQAPGFITILRGPDHVFEFANAAYRRLFGDRAYVGRSARDVFPELADQDFFALLDRVYATGERFVADRIPIRISVTPSSEPEERFLDFIYEPLTDEAGRVSGIFVEGYDVTDQHRAEAERREANARLAFLDRLGAATAPLTDADALLATTTRMLGEYLGASLCAYADVDEDEDGFTIRGDWAAPGARSIVGHYQLGDFGRLAVSNLGAGLPLVVNDNLRELAPEEAATFQDIGIAATICMPLVKEGRLTALMAVHDRVPRTWTEDEMSLVRDVTARSWAHIERVAAIAELRESEEQLRLATEAAEVALWDLDLETDTLFWPPRVKAMFGISPDAPVTMDDFYACLHPDDRERTVAVFQAALDPATRAFYDVEYRTIGKEDGIVRWVAAKGRGVFDEGGRCVRAIGTAVDITARHEIEAALRESEARVRALTDNLPGGMVYQIGTGPDGGERRFLYVSQSHEKLTGIPAEAVFADPTIPYQLIVPEDRPRLVEAEAEAIRTQTPFDVEVRFRRADGAVRWCRILSAPRKQSDGSLIWDGIQIDTTDQKASEAALRESEARLRELNDTLERRVVERTAELEQAHEQLRQSQKLEAMGQLTGGVSHDFNNLLAPIIGSLDLLQRKGLGGEREQRLIDGALQSAERARVLVQRLLAFARRQPLQPKPVDVGALVGGMADLVATTTGPQIKVKVDIAPDLPAAVADPNQIEMAVLNLSVNARDAMPEGGTLRISANGETIRAGQKARLQPGRYVRLSVADTGIGMDEATLKRAIEPFFSTKGVGRGTGLGLSMVHGLALQLGGALTIESTPGLGTNAEIWLPASEEAASEPERQEESEPLRSAGTALLVDDEELVRTSTADMLAELGYQVVEVSSAEEALRRIEAGLAFDVLVTDHLMPGMTGTALARTVREQRSQTPVLVVSGFAEVEGIAPDLPRLVKPFRQSDLAAKLREVSEVPAR